VVEAAAPGAVARPGRRLIRASRYEDRLLWPDVSVSETQPARDAGERPGDTLWSPAYAALSIGIVALISLVAFEAMAVGTAMPRAVADLDGLTFYAWGFSGFMTASMFGTVLAGEACDRFGPLGPFLAGIGLFTGGLVVAGAAPTILVFLVGRVVQGLGGAAVIVAVYVIVARAYPSQLRPRVFAVMSAAWVLPSVVGPLVAGIVTETWTWRLVFLGLAPFAVAPVLLVLPRLRALPSVEPAERRPGQKLRAAATAVGVGVLQYAGQAAGEELRWWIPLLGAVGLVLMAVGLPGLLPAGTLRFARGLPTVVGLRGLFSGAFFGAQAFIILMLQEQRGMTATMAGLALTVGALGWSAGSWWQGRPATRTPRHRLIELGAIFVTVGIVVVLVSAHPSLPAWLPSVAWVLSGLGMGLSLSSLSVLLLEYSPPQDQGANVAAGQVSDSLGNVLLVATTGVIFASLHEVVAAWDVYRAIYLVTLAVALAGVVVARRVRPPVSG
jgi:MFS family permease